MSFKAVKYVTKRGCYHHSDMNKAIQWAAWGTSSMVLITTTVIHKNLQSSQISFLCNTNDERFIKAGGKDICLRISC